MICDVPGHAEHSVLLKLERWLLEERLDKNQLSEVCHLSVSVAFRQTLSMNH